MLMVWCKRDVTSPQWSYVSFAPNHQCAREEATASSCPRHAEPRASSFTISSASYTRTDMAMLWQPLTSARVGSGCSLDPLTSFASIGHVALLAIYKKCSSEQRQRARRYRNKLSQIGHQAIYPFLPNFMHNMCIFVLYRAGTAVCTV